MPRQHKIVVLARRPDSRARRHCSQHKRWPDMSRNVPLFACYNAHKLLGLLLLWLAVLVFGRQQPSEVEARSPLEVEVRVVPSVPCYPK